VLKLDPRGLHAAVNQHLPVSNETFLTFRNCNLEYPDVQQVAAAYFIVNRCSFSGATFCGGFSAEASEKRCNQSAVDRLLDVDMKNITLSNQDAIEFLRSHPERPDTVVYADPPYYITSYVYGKNGDMHEGFDHVGFADYLKTRSDWILSYNDCPYIRDLYAGCRIVTESWKYGMNNGGKPSSEVIILPPGKTDVDASCEQSVDV
jgi:DNA adenine methylase